MVEQSRGAGFRAQGDAAEDDKLREFAADRLIRFLNTSKIELPGDVSVREVLRSKETIKNFILSLSPENYNRLLIGINAMVRNKSGHETWHMDGEGVKMGGNDIFPAQADKEALLAQSLEAAKQMAAAGRSTEDIALLLSISLTAIHPFINGNGRTARFLLLMLIVGYDPKLLKEMVTSDGFSNTVNANRFQAEAMHVLDPENKLSNEAYDQFMTVAENRRKIAELVIDIFLHDRDANYMIDGKSALEFFKEELPTSVNIDLYKRMFIRD